MVLLAMNAAQPTMELVDPPVTAEAVFAQSEFIENTPPSMGCHPLENKEEMAGKWCLTDRGACYFQQKYYNCMEAGAVGAIVINRADAVFRMGVQPGAVEDGGAFIMIGQESGDMIKDYIGEGTPVTLSAGKMIGVPEANPAYTAADPLGSASISTGERDMHMPEYESIGKALYDHEQNLLFLFKVNGDDLEHHVLDMSVTVDGTYPLIGTFGPSAFFRFAGFSDYFIFHNDAGSFLLEKFFETFFISDITGDKAADPELLVEYAPYDLGVIEDECESFALPHFHPSGNYLYVGGGGDIFECDVDVDGDGIGQDYVVYIFDISDPSAPEYVKRFKMPEFEEGTAGAGFGGWEWAWDPNDIAGIATQSGGFSLYDFSDPLNPMLVSEIFDPNPEISNTFVAGVYSSVSDDDGVWYVYDSTYVEVEDDVYEQQSVFHQLKAVEC